MGNQTVPMEFILNDFSVNPGLQIFTFILFLVIYLAASGGNILIILIILHAPHLWTPMYFFVVNLGILDMCYISTTVPNFLKNSLSQRKTISFIGCVIQLYVFLSMAATESTLLAVMSYDRYVAICNPLHYHIIMNRKNCLYLAVSAWFNGTIYSIIHTTNTFRLQFCQSNVIDHFFCDITPLLKIACSNTKLNEIMIFGVGAVMILPCFPLIITSYIYIIKTVLRIPSAKGRSKTFSTCVSHLTTVGLFYLTGISVYLHPVSTSTAVNQDKISAVFYTMLVPMVNPIIYSLRNKELKEAILKRVFIKLIL
ncbi:olfactory receptor-like protein OLF1 [Bombina bombina]|uniref:olfactory receptor-like protein OLF1 n=1 Tax=Bombina bombina TaxID=8345 RepID=UPI00235AF664|nr:olfactory receptor-like protein OLF1 [Bombina bombina]